MTLKTEIQQKSHLLMQMALYYYFAAGFGLASTTSTAFFLSLCGLVLPKEPIAIFPLAVFLSPFPIVLCVYLLSNQ
jgi:hypothetical protein